MTTLFILLLSCLPCFAQFGVEQPMFQLTSAAQFTPESIPGIAYYWTARDFTNATTGTETNRWIDHVQGYILTNGNPSTLPMITSTGLYFYGPQHKLTNNLIYLPAVGDNTNSWTTFCNVKLGITVPVEQYYMILRKSDAVLKAWRWAKDSWADTFNNGATWCVDLDPTTKVPGSGTKLPHGQYMTLCSVVSNFFNGAPNYTTYFYTNGVLSYTYANATDTAFDNVGYNPADSSFWLGLINDVIIYTNRLSSVQVSNLNRMAFSP